MANKSLVDFRVPVVERGVKQSFKTITIYELFEDSRRYRVVRHSYFIKTLHLARTREEAAICSLSFGFGTLLLFEKNVYGSGIVVDDRWVKLRCLSSNSPDDFLEVEIPSTEDRSIVIDNTSARAAIIHLLKNFASLKNRNEYENMVSSSIIMSLFRYTFLVEPKRTLKEELNRLKQKNFISMPENGAGKPSLVSLINDEQTWHPDDIAKMYIGDPLS